MQRYCMLKPPHGPTCPAVRISSEKIVIRSSGCTSIFLMMYLSGTVGNICLIADDKSVRTTSAFELKFPASPIVKNENVFSVVVMEK